LEEEKKEVDNTVERTLAINKMLSENRIFAFNKGKNPLYPEARMPNPPQKKLLDAWRNPQYKVFTYTGGNRGGKTFLGGLLAVCTAMGEYPWSGEKIPFPHNEPRKIRYVGQAWESHVKAVVEPMLKFWWPKSRPLDTKKNNQGIEAIWIDKRTKSSIEIMSNVQDSSVFEGWNGDLVIYDEPPKRDVRVACARGLIDRNGRELFCMTLLKEAWVSREVIKAFLPDGSPDLSVFNVNMEIYSNLGYGLTQEGIDQFAKTLTEAEKRARLNGHPAYLESLVFPKFNRQTHVKEPFKIPLDWIVDISIDFHPSKKWAVVFMATAKNGIKYICDEIHEHGNPKFIAEEIIRKVTSNQYRVGKCIIDPLSKGDGNNDQTVYDIMGQTLSSKFISLDTASKDKDNGIALVNNLLMTENELPGLYYFRTCHKSIQETEDLMFDEETFKPQKKDDDFTECIYRLALLDTVWYAERNFDIQKQGNFVL
jgi:hypothetical protein